MLTHALPSVRGFAALGEPAGVPLAFRFYGLQTFACGDQTHTIAQFVLGGETGRRFSLVPGGLSVSLGYAPVPGVFPLRKHVQACNKIRQWDTD